MKVAVTGARGFLGSHLVRGGAARGAAVVALAREATASMLALADVLADPSKLDGVDVLVHAAAIRHRHGAAPSSYRASNVELVSALMKAAAGRVGRFVHVSSVGVYGFPRDLPISERSPFAPKTLYSQTKIDAEKSVRELGKSLGLGFTIVRPTIIYGRGDTNGMLDKLAAMIRAKRYLVVGDGQNTLHHTHVDDVVDAIFALAGSELAVGEDFIVAGPETITLRALSDLVASHVGGSVPRAHVPIALARAVATAVDIAAYRGIAFDRREPPINNEKLDVMTVPIAFDNAKLRRVFTPRVGYDEGLRRTLSPGTGPS